MVDATHRLCPFEEDPVERQGCLRPSLGSLLHEVGVDEFKALSELKAKVRLHFLVRNQVKILICY
jgi:hypothetical protein